MYAVIEDSGRQFKVREVPEDLENADLPKSVTFDRVLFVGGEGAPKIGNPVVDGATVTADVEGFVKGKKLRVVKVKRRKGYHVENGHRQKYLQVKVTGINA